MARNGSGVFTLPVADYSVGTTIVAADMNSNLGDIETALTQSIASDGQTTPTANLTMGGFKHLLVADATLRTQYLSAGQSQDGGTTYAAATDGGTDAYTASLSPAVTAYVTGMVVQLKFNEANTTATPTIALNGIASPKTIVRKDGGALAIGDIAANGIYDLVYTGTNFQIGSPSASFWLASSVTAQSTDAGAGVAPSIIADRFSASPAASDFIGSFDLQGRSSTAVNRTYVRLVGQITDATNASEDAEAFLQVMVAGTLTQRLRATATGVVVTGTFSATDVLAGTYTPTLTNTTNLDGSGSNACQYMRVGATVTVSGAVDVNPTTAAGTLTTLGISLPVASNFAASPQCGGIMSAQSITEAGAISADAANDRAELNFAAVSAANHTVWFTFTYQIV